MYHLLYLNPQRGILISINYKQVRHMRISNTQKNSGIYRGGNRNRIFNFCRFRFNFFLFCNHIFNYEFRNSNFRFFKKKIKIKIGIQIKNSMKFFEISVFDPILLLTQKNIITIIKLAIRVFRGVVFNLDFIGFF